MTDIAAAPDDGLGRALQRFDRVYAKVEDVFGYISAASIMFLMFLATYQVVSRKVFNAPIWGYVDYVEIAMGLFAFMAIAYCQRLGGHVRMELIIGRFRGRLLWCLEAIGVLVSIVIIVTLLPGSWDHFLRAYELGDSTINIDLPLWPSKLLVPIAFTTLLIRLVIHLIGYIRLFIRPETVPIAVTMIHDVEEEARKEIQDAFGDKQDPEAAR